PIQEKFLVAPRASIGGIPYAGWAGIASALALVLGISLGALPIYFLVVVAMTCVWVWLVNSVFLYKTWLDWCFHQEVSLNTYAEYVPEDGKYDYTIVFSGHTDTSWNWKHSAVKSKLNPAFAFIKVGFGAVCAIAVTLFAYILCFSLVAENYELYYAVEEVYCYLAPFLIIGCFLVTLWLDKNEKTASPGAMDNATGIAIAYEAVKYFKENPDKAPKNCRLIDLNCGSEEAGLRGSIAFTRRHKGEAILENCWNINIDSVADEGFFEVVHGDTWQFTKFDKNMQQFFKEAMREAGIEKPGDIVNPVGGCDSTPFTKAGVRSITFAAQNPILTNYYHTHYDQPERFTADTVGLGLDVVLRVVDKISAFEENSAK
ncbi:MAG: M28 family metallopeptidase, partial [Clostridia bacterium]|nr:M28 family metallopeptidase [Clostridia bacterium]